MNKIIEWFTNGENIKTVTSLSSAVTSLSSVVISFFMWQLNRKNSILSSYTQKAKPQILIKNTHLRKKSFEIKLNTSKGLSYNNKINTNKRIELNSAIGGIRDANLIELIEQNPVGTSKTVPSSKKEKLEYSVSKKKWCINLSEWFPYEIVNIDIDVFQINRYCNYLIIEDYLGNIDVALISLKLILSKNKNKLKNKFGEEKIIKQSGYYCIVKENIVTKWDIYSNLERVKLSKEISEIKKNCKNPSEEDIEMINHEFDLFEMKKYIKFLKMLDLIKLNI